MCRTARLTSVGVGYLCLLISASLGAGEPKPPDLSGKVQQAVCFSSHNDFREPAMYLSAVFEIRVPKNAGIWYPRDMAKVFEAYLKQKYGYVSTVNETVFCSPHDTAQMAQGVKDSLAAEHRNRKQPIVETGWKMTQQQAEAAVPSAAAAPATAAAKPNPAVTIHGYCMGNQGPKIYFGALFSSPREVPPVLNEVDRNRPTTDLWAKSFNAYLAQDHGFQGATGRCFAFEALGGAQLNWGRQLQMARAHGPASYAETGWTYKSN
jgi:hypothetical protein